jgi:hypothetical protein
VDAVTTLLELIGLLLLVAAIVLLGFACLIAGLAAGGILALFLAWALGRRAVKP